MIGLYLKDANRPFAGEGEQLTSVLSTAKDGV
jgi:hypothetical protein